MLTVVDLLREDGLEPRKVTGGGEHCSPCPGCGGDDRMRSWIDGGKGGRFWCRSCEERGDAIAYLRKYRRLGWRDACEYLGIDPQVKSNPGASSRAVAGNFGAGRIKGRDTTAPGDEWQRWAAGVIDAAERALWAPGGADALADLTARGLKSETLKKWRVGYIAESSFKPRFVPAGILFPCIRDGKAIKLKVRRRDNGEWWQVKGSETATVVYGEKDLYAVVENERDGLLLWQEAGELVAVVALGSVTMRPDKATFARLQKATVILCALDKDDPGAKEAWSWWAPAFGKRFHRWPPISRYGKDPGEMSAAGVSLRDWIEIGLEDAGARGGDRKPTESKDNIKGSKDTLIPLSAAAENPGQLIAEGSRNERETDCQVVVRYDDGEPMIWLEF